MVKLIFLCHRRAEVTHASYVEHLDQRLSETGEDWDGIAELHFASTEDLQHRMYASAEGERII